MSQTGQGAKLLSDRQVDIIATRLAERLAGPATGVAPSGAAPSGAAPSGAAPVQSPRTAPAASPRAKLGEGVFATIDDAVDGELVTKALAKFDTPMAAQQKTPVVETRMIREPAVVENAGYVLDLKFAILSDELSVQDKLQLDTLIRDWDGVRNIRLSAIGHSDSQRIKPTNRHLFTDNYVLSRARAMSAAFYIADALDVSLATVKIRLHRARARLREALDAGCDFSHDERNVFVCEPKAGTEEAGK